MRRRLLAGIVGLLAIAWAMPSAHALLLEQGPFVAHLRDGGVLYTYDANLQDWVPRAPLDIDTTPYDGSAPGSWADTGAQVGDEQRTLFNVDDIIYSSGSSDVFTGLGVGGAGTLTGLLYDLKVADLTVVDDGVYVTTTLYFTAGTRNPAPLASDSPANAGGVVEVWYDPSTPENGQSNTLSDENDIEVLFDPQGTGAAPFLWTESGGDADPLQAGRNYDAFPTVNNMTGWADDATLWLQAVFAPIGTRSVQGVAVPILATQAVRVQKSNGAVTGNLYEAYLDVVGGSVASLIEKDIFGDGQDLSLAATLEGPGGGGQDFTYDESARDYGDWALGSHDPIQGAFIPEPATLTLLGLGFAGLVLRRRKK